MAFKKGNIPWNVGIPISEKTREKLCESCKGRIVWNKDLIGEEFKSHYKNGMKGIFKKGHEPHNKGLMGWSQGHPGYMLGKKQTEEAREKISEANKGCTPWNKGKTCPQLSGTHKPNWKGGISSLVERIRKSYKYRQWRDDVFMRDDFTCQECGQKGFALNAHHIKSFSIIFEEYKITILEEALLCDELWNINNGITLCEECHYELKQ